MPQPSKIRYRPQPSSIPLAMADVLREAAELAVMPRFQRLSRADIDEKSPGELVTTADCEAERIIAAGLAAIKPGARVIGEEACARDASLLRGLGEGDVWMVDPIDGTNNYAAGRAPFALMAALISHGEIAAACILDPLSGSITCAELGGGAWIDGKRLVPRHARQSLSSCAGIISSFQRPTAMEPRIARLAARIGHVAPTQRCAGAEYPLVASGARDFALYWRTLVWDHAPGVLILNEAGGKAARLDGAPYRPADQNGAILLANSGATWDQIAAVLAA